MRRFVKAVALLAALTVLGLAAPASAGPLSNKLICVATGNVVVSQAAPGVDDTVTWTINAAGLCTGDGVGPHIARVHGSGTSTNLGLCDDLVVRDLSLEMQLELESVSTGTKTQIDQVWRAPVTTFPVATPFFVDNDAGKLSGAGSIFTRLGGRCPPEGSSGANIEWQFLKA